MIEIIIDIDNPFLKNETSWSYKFLNESYKLLIMKYFKNKTKKGGVSKNVLIYIYIVFEIIKIDMFRSK